MIELLTGIAVIALLIALLMPALHAAQDAARSLSSGSRVGQFALAAEQFRVDHGVPPLFPVLHEPTGARVPRDHTPPAGGTDARIRLANFRGFGALGMDMHPVYHPFALGAVERDLNTYVLPDLNFASISQTSGGQVPDNPRARERLPLFKTPGEGVTLSFEDTPSGPLGLPDPPTLFEAVGTSYLTNTLWMDASINGVNKQTLDFTAYGGDAPAGRDWRFARYVLQKMDSWSQSRTVMLAEGGLVIAAHQASDPTGIARSDDPQAWSRDEYVLWAAFLDGHARRVSVREQDVTALRAATTARLGLLPSSIAAPRNPSHGQWQWYPPGPGNPQ